MALAYFRILNNEFLNKDPGLFPEQAPIIILRSKLAVCMAKNVKDVEYTINSYIRMHFVRNREDYNMHKILRCKGGLNLEDIGTNNIMVD